MNVLENLYYTEDHEWLKVEGNVGYIGVTDFAQGELGDIVYIDITTDDLVKDQSFGSIEAVKTVSDLLAPCSGTIVEKNEKLNNDPQLVNSDPYGEGWIVKIEISDLSELEGLLSAAQYTAKFS